MVRDGERAGIPMGVMAGVWCFLAGGVTLANFLVGLVMAWVILRLFRPFFPWRPSIVHSLRKLPAFGNYVLHFLRELIRANLQVAYLVLHPRMPIRPGIIAYRTRHTTPLGITLLANSITLTPGTLTMDVDPEERILYIHTLDVPDPETVAKSIRQGLEEYTVKVVE